MDLAVVCGGDSRGKPRFSTVCVVRVVHPAKRSSFPADRDLLSSGADTAPWICFASLPRCAAVWLAAFAFVGQFEQHAA